MGVYIVIGVLLLCVGMLSVSTLMLWRERVRIGDEKREAEIRYAAERDEAAKRFAAEKAEAEAAFMTEKSQLETRLYEAERQSILVKARLESAEADRKSAEETFKAQFRNLANDILGEQTRHFRETNKDELDKLLKPFKDNITDFRERVEKIYSFENEQRGTLRGELNKLMELNRRITDETANLAKALKGDSKMQGDLGEMLLETILENSNLVRGQHYETQYNIKDEEGNNLRPDVVLKLPEGKRIVIDSKMSLTAYMDYVAAEDDDARERALTAHIASVRRHVRELSAKEYHRLLESPEFVIMFIPSEAAFLTAMHNANTIWSEAYEHKVIISSPTNLFAVLKLVDDLWKRNEQNKNTAEIVRCGTKLYDQLVNYVSAMEGVGASLDKARASYDEAYKRLCTGNDNIIRSGERLRKLGLPTKRRQSARAIEISGSNADEEPAESGSPDLLADAEQ